MKNNLYNTLSKMEEYEGANNIKTYKCFYHASTEIIPEDLILTPRTPKWPMNQEDSYIPRISLSRSIEGSLKGIYFKLNYNNRRAYIYRIFYDDKILKIVEPTMRAVPDGYITDELWCLSEIPQSYRQLVGIATNISMINNDVDRNNNITFNDTVMFYDDYNRPRIASCGEVYFNYIPAKIVKSPYIKVDTNKNKEYEKYLINEKNNDYNNPDPFEFEKNYRYSEAGLNYYQNNCHYLDDEPQF